MPAGVATAWAHVDYVIGVTDKVEIVFDHDNRGALGNEAVEHTQQHLNIERMQADPNFSLDSSDGVYIVFMIIGIIGYFTIPTVSGWIIQAGGMGNYGRNVNQTAGKAGGFAGSVAGATAGNVAGRVGKLLR